MFKRIAASILAAAIVSLPLIFSILIERGNILNCSDFIMDEHGYNYSLLSNLDKMMFVKSDGSGKILGKWKKDRTNGYIYTSVDAMNVYNGEFYCVLSEIDSRSFMIISRSWLKIDFEKGTAETIYEKEYKNIQNAYSTSLTITDEKMITVSPLAEGILVTDVYGNTEKTIKLKNRAVINYAAALPNGRILYSDILNRIYIKCDNERPRRIYKADAAGDFYELSVNNGGFCVIRDTQTNKCYISSDNKYKGEIIFKPYSAETESDIPTYSDLFGIDFIVYCVMGVIVGIIVFVLMSLKRLSVLLKIAVILALCLWVGGMYMFDLIDLTIEKLHLEKSVDNACMSAKIIDAEIDLDKFEKIDWSAPESDGYFPKLEALMKFNGESEKILNTSTGKDIHFDDKNYCWIYPIVDGELKSGICDQYPVNLPIEKVVPESLLAEYKQVAKGDISSAACGISDDSFDWVIVVSPLKNSEGNIIALIETGISKLNYKETSMRNSSNIFMLVTAFEIITGSLILIATGIALIPLKRVHKAVEAAANGTYGVMVKVKGRDEIAAISKAFNEMSQQIYSHTQKLSKINEAYLRFLPSGIISTIGKPSVLSVSRGDYSSISGYILHIRFINFSEQTENLSNDEMFSLINNISREIMENVIGKNGVIESYNQEEYICIFGEADPAYDAAIALIKRLRELYPRLKTSFVIVKDSMLLGIVGHEKRLGTIMLSRGIRLSKKLGKIASLCGANLIVTSDVVFSAPCPQRVLGKIEFDEREYTYFDCFAGDEISVYLSKLDGCAQFEKVVEQFHENNWTKCRRLALSYLEKHKNDPAAVRYLFLCEDNIKHYKESASLENMIV